MGKWKLYTPDGTGDILFEDCFVKRHLESLMRSRFIQCGYREIETPSLEFMDVFTNGKELIPQESMFKLIDREGRMLVLRPDATIPAARIAATKFREEDLPVKLFYIGNMFRSSENRSGGANGIEFTQAGAELLGASTPEADAEVIARAIYALRDSGLENFQIDVGQVEFFKGIMGETGLSEDETEQIRVLIDAKDFVGIEELVGSHQIDGYLKELIFNMPRLFGSAAILDGLDKSKLNARSLSAIGNLKEVINILNDYGVGKYVSVDLGMVQSLNYYTGTIFKGFTHGVGSPVLSGGRYDTLVGRFGKECPATGFSLSINILMAAIANQKIEMPRQTTDSLVAYAPEARAAALELCSAMREDGLSIDLHVVSGDIGNACGYAEKRGIGGVIYLESDGVIYLCNISTKEKTRTSFDELRRGMEAGK